VRGRVYAPKGQTPVVRVNNKREGLSVISTVANRSKVRWKVFRGGDEREGADRLLKRLTKYADRRVFLILDNLKVDHARKVNAWLADHDEQIKGVVAKGM